MGEREFHTVMVMTWVPLDPLGRKGNPWAVRNLVLARKRGYPGSQGQEYVSYQ